MLTHRAEITLQTDRRNILVLAACQALLVTTNVVLISLNGLVGHALAANKALATLPVTAFVLGSAVATVPASLLMHRVGRARGFTVGAVASLAGAALCALAVLLQAFWLLCAGNVVCGVGNASAAYYRFAAADAAGSVGKERAISLVLAGGLLGGLLGPQSSTLTKDAFAIPFLGSYALLVLFALATAWLVRHLVIPPLSREEGSGQERPVAEVVRQPTYLVAVLAAAVSYAVMNLLMTATPLAMQACHHAYADAAFVIGWHVVGMYAPSFVTGTLVKRFGVLPLMLAGTALMFVCVGVALSGDSVLTFWVALVLLGVGWNFLYVGGTTLLTDSYRPAERAKAQGINDFVVFASMAVSSLSAGALVTSAGFRVLNYVSVPFLALVTAGILLLWNHRRRAAAGAQSVVL